MSLMELDTLVAGLKAMRAQISDVAYPQMRLMWEAMSAAFPLPAGITAQDVTIAGRRAQWQSKAGADASKAVLYLHGGGYCLGSPNTHRMLTGTLAHALDGRVLVLDYRLAPEHQHPAAVDDALAALAYIASLGIDPAKTVIMGDSAGGGLALATALAAKAAGTALPGGLVLLSPWVDLTQSADTYTSKALEDPVLQKVTLDPMAAAYLGDQSATQVTASPLFGDLSGLPPLLIQVGSAETLLGDSQALAAKAQAAGVAVTLDVWDKMIHVWQAYPHALSEARDALAQAGTWINARQAG
jgi:epsilon-lactone hydrolase